jgi:hypothetical protein
MYRTESIIYYVILFQFTALILVHRYGIRYGIPKENCSEFEFFGCGNTNHIYCIQLKNILTDDILIKGTVEGSQMAAGKRLRAHSLSIGPLHIISVEEDEALSLCSASLI